MVCVVKKVLFKKIGPTLGSKMDFLVELSCIVYYQIVYCTDTVISQLYYILQTLTLSPQTLSLVALKSSY